MDHETGAGPGEADRPGLGDDQDDQASARHAAAPTGDARVDEALRPLAGLAAQPVADHPPVFERLHTELVEVLGELGPGSGLAG